MTAGTPTQVRPHLPVTGTVDADEDTQTVTIEALNGVQKVAIVLAQLDSETSSTLLRTLGHEESILLATEMAKLPPLRRDVVVQVLDEFVERVNTTRSIGQGGMAQARRMLASVIGEQQATEVMLQSGGSVAIGPLAFLSNAEPEHVVPHLIDEHPQTVAVILAHLSPPDGARLLDAMPGDFRAEVAVRIATMDRVSPDAIGVAAAQLASKLRGLGSSRSSVPGGIPALVDLLNLADGSTEKQVLGDLEARSPELAEAIRARMFTFEDVLALDDQTIQVLLRNVPVKDLALAMRGTTDNPEAMEKITRNLSERGRAELAEEMDVMGSVRASLVDGAQSSMVRTVRELEASGAIVIGRGNDELI
jgi:flagellar motor switch protein FliG